MLRELRGVFLVQRPADTVSLLSLETHQKQENILGDFEWQSLLLLLLLIGPIPLISPLCTKYKVQG